MWGFKNIRNLINKAHDIAQEFRQKETQLIEVLQRLDETKAYRATGHNSLFQFCVESLQLTEHQSYNYITVARKCVEIPELMVALEDRRITVSKARKMSSVINSENKTDWIQLAENGSQKDLELAVRRKQPLPPVRDHLQIISQSQSQLQATLDASVETKLRRVMELLSSKSHKKTSINEALDKMCDEYLKKHDPIKKAQRAQLRGSATEARTSDSSQDERSPAKKRRRTRRPSLPAATKHHVWLRDRGQCRFHRHGKRCKNTRYLEVHHKQPVSQGGSHSLDNLVLVCAEHHKTIHMFDLTEVRVT